MTAFRLFSLPTHAVVEMLAGIALMGLPFALGFSGAGLVVAFTLGVLVVGLALGGSDSLPVAAHFALDHLLVAVFIVVSLGLGLAGDRAAAAVFLVAAVVQLTLTLTTRYSRPLISRRT